MNDLLKNLEKRVIALENANGFAIERLEALEKNSHVPYDFSEMEARLKRLEEFAFTPIAWFKGRLPSGSPDLSTCVYGPTKPDGDGWSPIYR